MGIERVWQYLKKTSLGPSLWHSMVNEYSCLYTQSHDLSNVSMYPLEQMTNIRRTFTLSDV